MLSASELARLQSDTAAAVCDQPCAIYRVTGSTPDGYSTNTPTYTQISPAGLLAGMSEPSAGELQNYDFLIADKIAWKVHLPYGTTVAEEDDIVIGSYTLKVHVVLAPQSYPALTDVIAAEIR